MPGDLQSPYPIDMLATAWVLGITNPQSIKRLGHFLTADCKSAGTTNGGRAYPAQREFRRGAAYACANTCNLLPIFTPRANLVPSGCVFITLLSYIPFSAEGA